jgi:hypothetical protein
MRRILDKGLWNVVGRLGYLVGAVKVALFGNRGTNEAGRLGDGDGKEIESARRDFNGDHWDREEKIVRIEREEGRGRGDGWEELWRG